MDSLVQELKELIIEVLDLEDITPDDIEADALLFGGGLGLDSIDALELGMSVAKRYQVKLEAEKARDAFQSVNALAEFIRSSRGC